MLKWFSQSGNLYISYNSKGGLNFYLKSQSVKYSFTCWDFGAIAKAGRILTQLANFYLQNPQEFQQKLTQKPFQVVLPTGGDNSLIAIVVNGQGVYIRAFERGQERFIYPIPLDDLLVLADYLSSYKVALILADLLKQPQQSYSTQQQISSQQPTSQVPYQQPVQHPVNQQPVNQQPANQQGNLPNPDQF